MHFSFSSLMNMTFSCSILVVLLYLLLLNNRMLARFGTTFVLGIMFTIMIRFLLPVEFVFTKSIYIYKLYPSLYHFFVDDFTSLAGFNICINDILFGIWIIGCILLYANSCFQYLKLAHTYSHCPSVDDETVLQALKEANISFNSQKKFHVVELANISTPMIFGLFKTYIILPKLNLTSTEWYYIFKHELTHYYSRHLIYKIICEFVCTLYWWNPFIHIFRKIQNNLLEMNVDAKVTSSLNDIEKIDYLLCLSKIAKFQIQEYRKPEFKLWAVTFTSPSKSYLAKRSHLIISNMEIKKKQFYFSTLAISIVFLFIFSSSVFFIFEPSTPINEVTAELGNEYFSFSEPGCFFIHHASGSYSLYVDWNYYFDLTELPTKDPNIRIYKNLEEAHLNEKK